MLNPRSIESAIRDCTREVLLTDGTAERGTGRLALRLRPSAKGVSAEWVVLWWRYERRHMGLMGRYPSLSLRAARDRFAGEWRPAIEAGRDPRRARAQAAAVGSVHQLFTEYVESMKERGCRSWHQPEKTLLTGRWSAVKALGKDTRAKDVTPDAITEFLGECFRRGSRTAADRTRAHLHAAFQWGAKSTHDYTRLDTDDAPRTHFGLTSNPVSIVPRDTEANKTRNRYLDVEEFCQLWRSVTAGNGFSLSTAPAIHLLLCTGQRVLDVLRADGCDFDLKAKLWIIPERKRKTGERDHVVVLPPPAVAVLRELIEVRGAGLLFPHAKKKGEHIPDQTVNRALCRWSQRWKVPRFQARDLRRTWKTLAGAAGLSKELRDKIQGHALTDVSSRHYDRYLYLREKRKGAAAWSRWVDKMLRAKPSRRKMNGS